MAKILSFTPDFSIVPVDTAYWVPAQINFSPLNNTGLITFYCYASQADHDAGKQNIGQKEYKLTADRVAAFLASGGLQMETLLAPVYQFAASVMDVDTGQKDKSGTAIMTSFFAGAKDA